MIGYRSRKSVLKVVFVLLAGISSHAQNKALPAVRDQRVNASTQERVQALIRGVLRDQHVPGMSVAIAKHGKVVYSRGFGLADMENGIQVESDTKFRTASIAKPMTATAAMKLVDMKKLDLDTPVQKYCPGYPEKKSPDRQAWTVTIRELLSHRSGIGWYEGTEQQNTKHYEKLADAVAVFRDRPLHFEPGSEMLYSSYGYVVAGCAIEGASGASYADYMRQAIFGPAGMTNTVVDDPRAIIPHRAHGYEPGKQSGAEVENSPGFDPSDRIPGGGLLSTSEDLVRFGSAVMSGKLVSAATLEQMWVPADRQAAAPAKESYGLGWGLYEIEGHRVVGHNGGQVGTSTALRLVPDAGLVVAVMSNLEGAKLDNLVTEISKVYLH